MLAATALSRRPGLIEASISVAAGEIVGLVGPNGAGKTTLLRALAGLSRGPGSVKLNGVPLASLPAAVRARRLAWLPAGREIGWPMRAADVVALGLGGRDDPAAVAAALAAVEAGALADRRIDTLSTGEAARVLLARALIARPEVLLLDEPVANLDPFHRLAIMDTLRRVADAGAVVIVALHDLDLAVHTCSRLCLMDAGRIVADGPPDAVLTPERLAGVFGIARSPAGWRIARGYGTDEHIIH